MLQYQNFSQQFIVLFESWDSISQVTHIRLTTSTYYLNAITVTAEEKNFKSNFQRHKSLDANKMQFPEYT